MYRYLGPEILSGFEGYKYSSVDTSPLSNYVMHPFWNQVVKICPRWVAPNLLTLVGFICCVGHYVMLTIYDYDFTAGVAEVPEWGSKEGVTIPGVVWVVVAVLLFLSHTLDGIDGKQARRTGTSGPIGELFDHGLDGWAAVFITCSVYHIFGRNDDHLSIPVYRMFCVLWAVHFCFMVSHWEKYNTGILYLPWGYDFSMVGGVILYLVTAVGGTKNVEIQTARGPRSRPLHRMRPICWHSRHGHSYCIVQYQKLIQRRYWKDAVFYRSKQATGFNHGGYCCHILVGQFVNKQYFRT